jgi:integrase
VILPEGIGVANEARLVGWGIVRIPVGHDVACDVIPKVAGRDRARIHGAVVNGLEIGRDDDHLLRAQRKGTFDRLRDVDLVRPLLGADGVTVAKRAPHDIRRKCAKLCQASGGELEQIQFLLGHVSVQTTERYLGSEQRIRCAVNDRIGIEPKS